jgi:hypothetical protein
MLRVALTFVETVTSVALVGTVNRTVSTEACVNHRNENENENAIHSFFHSSRSILPSLIIRHHCLPELCS